MSNNEATLYLFDEVEYELYGNVKDLSIIEQEILRQRELTRPEVIVPSVIKPKNNERQKLLAKT